MRKLVDAKSEPGASRLPTFNTEWTKIINGDTQLRNYFDNAMRKRIWYLRNAP